MNSTAQIRCTMIKEQELFLQPGPLQTNFMAP